ncbi:MAG: HAMP domain-containing histidine kinase [Rubrivivax sp.]|nr:HAMP domain-containing histidine kinase [Rubrivivax sp.]
MNAAASTLRAVYRTDPAEPRATPRASTPLAMHSASEPPASPLAAPMAPAPAAAPRPGTGNGNGNGNAAAAALPLPLLAAVGERLAAVASRAIASPATAAGELARLEAFGLQLQELAHVVARAQQLRQESVDLGLALLQTVAEWSAEAARQGVELHGPACSEPVLANPAALKHLLDLMVEHALQQGRAVRLQIELPADGGAVRLVAAVSSEPAAQSPARDTLASSLLQWFARALGLPVEREAVPRGERVVVALPRG